MANSTDKKNPFTRHFEDLSSSDVGVAGGKGASLGEMTRAGIPVPPGFVILADSFDTFLDDTELRLQIDTILKKVDHRNIATIDWASEKIQSLILSASVPQNIETVIWKNFEALASEYVAVRSSATAEDSAEAAWAGQLESYLNTTRNSLLLNVLRCWASLFTPRAIYYRFDKGLHGTPISVAVVVQKMVQSEISGIGFSVHPVTEDRGQIIIEAGYGLGEAVVSGSVTPDSYIVRKHDHTILVRTVNTQDRALVRQGGENVWVSIAEDKATAQTADDASILRLASIIKDIERHYGFPVDVEWGMEGGEFYIVQSRPITTLREQRPHDEKKERILESVKDAGKWVSLVERPMCLLLRDIILKSERTEVFNEAFGAKVPPIGDVYVRGHIFYSMKAITEASIALERMVAQDGYRKVMEIGEQCVKRADTLHRYLCDAKGGLPERLRRFEELYISLAPYLLIVVFSEKFLQKKLEELVVRKVGSLDQRFFEGLVYVRKPNVNTEELVALLSLCQQLKDQGLVTSNPKAQALLRKHSEEFGWLGTRWQFEDGWSLTDVEARAKRYCAGDPAKELADVRAPRVEAERVTQEFISRYACTREEIALIDLVKEFVFLRTFRTESVARTNALARPLLEEASRTLEISVKDLLFLSLDEIQDALAHPDSDTASVITERKKGYYIVLADNEISVFAGEDRAMIDALGLFSLSVNHEGALKGQVAWKGFVEGTARIVKEQADITKVGEGDILVAVMTFPNYIPAMEKASAFVTDEGGILCHAAIISREMKKPCVIGTKVATRVIKDGDRIEVDAYSGIVRVVNPEK